MTAPSFPADGAGVGPDPAVAASVASPHVARAPRNRLTQALWITGGTLMLSIGVVGVVVPGLPTTIFVILALACYARSSQRFYDRVANNRVLGRHARAFRESGVMPRRAKQFALGMMWPFVAFAVFFAIPDRLLWAKALTVALALLGTAYILWLPSEAN